LRGWKPRLPAFPLVVVRCERACFGLRGWKPRLPGLFIDVRDEADYDEEV